MFYVRLHQTVSYFDGRIVSDWFHLIFGRGDCMYYFTALRICLHVLSYVEYSMEAYAYVSLGKSAGELTN